MKNHKSCLRIITGSLLPLILATLGYSTYLYITFDGLKLPGIYGLYKQLILEAFFPIFIYAIVLAGIQSIFYSFKMEKANQESNNTLIDNISFIIYSAGFGVFCSLLAGLVTQQFILFSVLGAIVGVIVGIILRLMFLKQEKDKTAN